MNTKITYGVYLALIGIVLELIGYFTGLESGKQSAGFVILGILMWLVGVVVFIVVLWLGVRAVREERGDQTFTYGQGLGAGVMIALVASVIGAVYMFIHYAFINSDAISRAMAMVPAMRDKWEQGGMDENTIAIAEKVVGAIYTPAGLAIIAFFMKFVGGVLVSLVIAAIVKRKEQPVFAAPPPLA